MGIGLQKEVSCRERAETRVRVCWGHVYHDRAWASAVGVMDGPGAGRLQRCTGQQTVRLGSSTVSRLVTKMAEAAAGDTCNARSPRVGTKVSEEQCRNQEGGKRCGQKVKD